MCFNTVDKQTLLINNPVHNTESTTIRNEGLKSLVRHTKSLKILTKLNSRKKLTTGWNRLRSARCFCAQALIACHTLQTVQDRLNYPYCTPEFHRKSFTQIRLASHHLKTKTGRASITLENHLCACCQGIKEEWHILLPQNSTVKAKWKLSNPGLYQSECTYEMFPHNQPMSQFMRLYNLSWLLECTHVCRIYLILWLVYTDNTDNYAGARDFYVYFLFLFSIIELCFLVIANIIQLTMLLFCKLDDTLLSSPHQILGQ